MDIFEKIFSSMEKATKKVVSVSEGVVETTKLRIALSQAESKIEALQSQIGLLVYSAYQDQSSVPEEVTAKCKEIEELYEEMESIKFQLASLRKLKICNSCGKENDVDASYCSSCGDKFDVEDEPVIDVDPEEKE